MSLMIGRARILTLCVVLAPVVHNDALAQTSVTLAFRGPLQEPVTVSHARLLVTAWGVSEEYDLPVEGNIVRIDLAATRPEFADRIADTTGFIYVKAAGYAPIMSEAFTWPAAGAPIVIDFRNGGRITVKQGTSAALDVVLRHPVPRRVRLVDLEGKAVAGAKVEAAAYWETPNHCGFMNGRDVLASGFTDEGGRMIVPDIDGPLVFSLLERQMLFADGDNNYPAGFDRQGLVISLSRPDTTLRVRRYRPQRLVLDIVSRGKPLPGAVLWADMGLGVCGAGYGPLATADPRGRIRQENFNPEIWRRYWICDGQKQVWALPFDGTLPRRIDVAVTHGREPNGLADRCGK